MSATDAAFLTRADHQAIPVEEVFTPTMPARLTFIERRRSVNDRLVDALRTPGKQVVLYGPPGSGKTTLLVNKLCQLYPWHLTTQCLTGMTFDQILNEAFGRLAPFYEAERTRGTSREVTAKLVGEHLPIKGELAAAWKEMQGRTHKALAPPPLTPHLLGRLLGATGGCWVVEDFHKIAPLERRRLAEAMKLFVDLAQQYRHLRVVAVGAVDSARMIVETEPSMADRVAEILVPMMSVGELRDVVHAGERFLNVTFPERIVSALVAYSNGLASVCHQLGLDTCRAAGIERSLDSAIHLTPAVFEEAVQRYVQNASDTLRRTFDLARRPGKSPRYRFVDLILEALVHLPPEGVVWPTLLAKVHLLGPEGAALDAEICRWLVGKLQRPERGEILRYEPCSGRYSFSDPIYRVFAHAFFAASQGRERAGPLGPDDELKTLVLDAADLLGQALAGGNDDGDDAD